MLSNTQSVSRLYFIDNLRTILAVLVISVHLATTYSGFGFWAYKEKSPDITSYLFLVGIITYGQAFIVSLFFLISGYFSSVSLHRRPLVSFVWGKILRLGFPFLLFYLLLSPMGPYIRALNKDVDQNYFSFLWESLSQFKNLHLGPPWFLLALLIFDGLFAVIYNLFKKNFRLTDSKLKLYYFLILFVIMAVSTLLVRNAFPIDKTLFGFRPANFPRYLIFYVGGILIHQKNWGPFIENLRIKTWMYQALFSLVILLIVFNFSTVRGNEKLFMGGFTWHSWFFAFWESYVAVVMSMLMIAVYKKYVNFTQPILGFMADHAYPVFIIHTPVLLITAYSLKMLQLPVLFKYFLVLVLSVSICFMVSFLLKRIPVLRKIF
ncbi:MAG: acyltransferase family protein [Bacteroidales bacterium]|nr:acyltransferase family protein [Bacteroidales bacterium]